MFPLLLAAAVLTRGQLVENVTCTRDASQSYTLYLPSNYAEDRRWPVLIVMDPRGRGSKAAEIFRPGAEENGWILISSNNTRSDTDGPVNDIAINAMWGDLAKYSIDDHRVYVAGFSGTATIAWLLAKQQHLAGVIASCPPYVEELDFAHAPFPYWAATGTTDFNYLDAHRIDREIARSGKPHHLEIFDGPHSWMPQDAATRAIAWMQHPSIEAAAPESSDERYEKRTLDRLMAALSRVRATNPPQPIADIERELGLASIRKTAAVADAKGLAARRVLELLYVQTSFYLPARYRAQHDAAREATVLAIAAAIKPDIESFRR